jgi:tRNA(Met) C34 N-acetyltransferase TmcA
VVTIQRRLRRKLLKQLSSAVQKDAANRKVSALRQKDAARIRANALRQRTAARRKAAARIRLAQSRSAQNVPNALSALIVRQAKALSKLNKEDIAAAISFF